MQPPAVHPEAAVHLEIAVYLEKTVCHADLCTLRQLCPRQSCVPCSQLCAM